MAADFSENSFSDPALQWANNASFEEKSFPFAIPSGDRSDMTLPIEPPEGFPLLSNGCLPHRILSVIKSILSNLRTDSDKDYGFSVKAR